MLTAIFWVFAGTMHFVIPRQYEAIVPPSIAARTREVVVISGLAEIAGGLAVLPSSTRRGARWWLLATLVAVYPANIHMARHPELFPKIPAPALWARLPVQGLFAWMTWRGTQ
jgi:uncharacterized membrane protein